MPLGNQQDDLLIAVALIRFESEFREADPLLAEWAGLLAIKHLEGYDLDPQEIVNELDIGGVL